MTLKKKGGADMLMELALSTIIFFVIVFFLFGINIPKQQLKACASVVSADATLACETSLMNLMRATNVPDGTKYSDFLMNSWLNNDMTAWEKDVTAIFDDVFGSGDWQMNVFLPNGTNITPTLGNINTQQPGCNYTIPFSAASLKKNCGYLETQVPKVITSPADVSFDTPDGNATFTVTDDETTLGVVCKSENCQLDLESKSIFEENIPSTIPNDPSIADSMVLPVLINGAPYELTVEELTDANGNVKSGFNATLAHSALLKDCGLTIALETTNVTDMVNTCKGKPLSSVL